jgi:site-specific DNA-adenine methylase
VRLVDLFPKDIECYCEPFLGGGSVLLEVLERYDCNAVGIDRDENLINFWETIANSPYDTVNRLLEVRQKDISDIKKLANSIKSEINSGSKVEAWDFYLLNRCSFSGSLTQGGLSPDLSRFTERQIMGLANYSFKYGDLGIFVTF